MNLKQVLYFPMFLAIVLIQLVYFSLTEIETLLVALLAVSVGFKFGPLLGLITFFAVYIAIRTVKENVSLLSSRIYSIGQAIDHVRRENQN